MRIKNTGRKATHHRARATTQAPGPPGPPGPTTPPVFAPLSDLAMARRVSLKVAAGAAADLLTPEEDLWLRRWLHQMTLLADTGEASETETLDCTAAAILDTPATPTPRR